MINKPDHPGFFWARSFRCQWWNLIVQVDGESPYLEISFVWDFKEDKRTTSNAIYEFGQEIIEPDVPKLNEDEKRY